MNQINKGKAGCENGVCSRIATMTTALSSARDLQGKQEVPFQCVYTATEMPVSSLGVPVTLALGEAACFRCLYHLEAGFSRNPREEGPQQGPSLLGLKSCLVQCADLIQGRGGP